MSAITLWETDGPLRMELSVRRTPALVVSLALGLFGVGAVPGAHATPAAAERAAAATLKAPKNVVAGERITLTGTQKLGRVTLRVQRKAGKRWVPVGKVRRAPARFTVSMRVPKSATGKLRLRVQATVKKRTRTLATARTPVLQQRLKLRTPTAPKAARATEFSALLTPARPGRKVMVQEYLDGRWSTVAPAARSGSLVRATLTTAGYPTYYRVVAAAHRGIPEVATDPVRSNLELVPTAIAHRAGAALAPEQTIAALTRTLADRVQAVEVDVQLTSDGVPVLVHDATWLRTTDIETRFPEKIAAGQTKIADLTLAEVKQLDAGSWFGPQFAGQQIPTLDEWLAHQGTRAGLVLEVKDPTVAGNAAVWTELDARLQPGGSLRQLNDEDKLVISSFGHDGLQAFKERHDGLVAAGGPAEVVVPVGALTYAAPAPGTLLWADEIHDMWQLTTRSATNTARAQRQTTSVWTADSVADHRRAIATGAERIISDHPENLTRALFPAPPPQP